MVYCKDCKHYSAEPYQHRAPDSTNSYCKRYVAIVDGVNGRHIYELCKNERDSDARCGNGAKYFEAKPLLKWWRKFF